MWVSDKDYLLSRNTFGLPYPEAGRFHMHLFHLQPAAADIQQNRHWYYNRENTESLLFEVSLLCLYIPGIRFLLFYYQVQNLSGYTAWPDPNGLAHRSEEHTSELQS